MPINYENKQMLRIALLCAVLTAVFMVILNHSWNLFSAGSKTPFTVQGEATIKQPADQAQITFTITKTAKTLADAQNQANTAAAAMISGLQTIGIDTKDIKTNNYSSNPNYNNVNVNNMMPIRQPDGQTIVSYTVTQNNDVTVHQIEKANSVIDTLTKLNVENIYGPNYTFSDEKQKTLISEVRVKAINDAKQKAEAIAKAAGIHLGRILNVQENGSGPYPVMMDSKANVGMGGGAVPAPTSLNPGETPVTETVTLFYDTW